MLVALVVVSSLGSLYLFLPLCNGRARAQSSLRNCGTRRSQAGHLVTSLCILKQPPPPSQPNARALDPRLSFPVSPSFLHSYGPARSIVGRRGSSAVTGRDAEPSQQIKLNTYKEKLRRQDHRQCMHQTRKVLRWLCLTFQDGDTPSENLSYHPSRSRVCSGSFCWFFHCFFFADGTATTVTILLF